MSGIGRREVLSENMQWLTEDAAFPQCLLDEQAVETWSVEGPFENQELESF